MFTNGIHDILCLEDGGVGLEPNSLVNNPPHKLSEICLNAILNGDVAKDGEEILSAGLIFK